MGSLIDAFWRAAAYCLHPRVIGLSLLPLLLSAVLAGVLGYFYWEAALDAVRGWLDGWSLTASALAWLSAVGAESLRSFIAPLLVLVLAVPLLVVFSLLVVALLMMPRLVDMVAERRFPTLERRHGHAAWQGGLRSLGVTLVALVALLLSMPLWLLPPLVLILPPLIWGWLSYKVMSYDALADHATPEELQAIVREHRLPLLGIGIVTGYLGAAPAMIWAVSAVLLVFAPVLIVLSVWLYTLVFAFSALWFSHYGLAALEARRRRESSLAGVGPVVEAAAPNPPLALPPL